MRVNGHGPWPFYLTIIRVGVGPSSFMKLTFFNSHVELGKRGLSNEEETGLKRIYRPDYRDPIEKQEEPEVNPADIEDDLKRYDSFRPYKCILICSF